MPDRQTSNVLLSFPDLKPAEAAVLAQELENELLKGGLRPADLSLGRASGETMDAGFVLTIVASAFASAVAREAVESAFGYLVRKYKTFIVAKLPNGDTLGYGSENRKQAETAIHNNQGVNYGTLGVVLLGASNFPAMEGLDNPSFAKSAALMRSTLTSEHTLFRDTKLLDLFDSGISPVEVADQIESFIDSNRDIKDLLIYYCGHGSFLRDRTYFLVLRTTRAGRESATGLKLRDLRNDLERRLIDKRLYLVLDCCFAAEAAREFMSQSPQEFVQAQLAESMPPSGWAVLAAAPRSMPAMAPEGYPYTMFTGALAEALQKGAPYLKQHFSLSDLAAETGRRIVQIHGPSRAVFPQSHAPMQDGGDLTRVPLFENKALDAAAEKAGPADGNIFEEITKQFQSPLAGIRKAALDEAFALSMKTVDPAIKERVAALFAKARNDDSREVSSAAESYAAGREAQAKPQKQPAPAVKAATPPPPPPSPSAPPPLRSAPNLGWAAAAAPQYSVQEPRVEGFRQQAAQTPAPAGKANSKSNIGVYVLLAIGFIAVLLSVLLISAKRNSPNNGDAYSPMSKYDKDSGSNSSNDR